jgi:N-acetylglucosamine kinase-like BadF-type ATPase
MPYYLGVDGGGTKTDVICADENGKIIGEGTAGPTNLTSTSIGAASFNLLEGIRQSLESVLPDQNGHEEQLPQIEFARIVMGLAGLDTDAEKERAAEIFQRALSQYIIQDFQIYNDSVIALANGTSNPNAVVLISGTGSICFGRNQAGQTAKTGGMDFLLTDQGSGYYIGRQVLREAVKSFDGRRSKTILEEMVCEHFRIPSIAELKNHVYNPHLTKLEVAEISSLCSEAYEQGDEAAAMIFDHAIEELVLLATTVVERLQLESQKFDLVLSGAVANLPHVQKQLTTRLMEKYTEIEIIFPDTPPVYGALKMAYGL